MYDYLEMFYAGVSAGTGIFMAFVCLQYLYGDNDDDGMGA